MKKINIDGDGVFFLIFGPIVIAIVWINYGFKTVITLPFVFGALYSYYMMFLNIIYAVKDKKLESYKNKIVTYSVVSTFIFICSTVSYGFAFSLKPLVIISVVSATQAILILRR
ncbi:hypothetical protein [Mucilaginibacter sp.]|uniref:hypothetical protein n=1 Tax=Mucilaginibacter sp. TaxID=1882438 RepID=UPI00261CF770|nr:hypothetical protein [Mucilaginibacter sp.]MDB4919929.1 hypothetical protein [Mucilaginibacter sp.]